MTETNEYEYVNEGLIDAELKCSICHRPFTCPVSTEICGHTFCQQCIETWLNQQQSCPTCRRTAFTSNFKPVSTRIVLNLLDRLQVQCRACRETNIQRGNWLDHQKKCFKRSVCCSFQDLTCSWTGKEDQRLEHERICPLRQVQPIIDNLHSQNAKLQSIVQLKTEQIRFLLILLNDGKTMSSDCSQTDYCQVFQYSPSNQSDPICNMCRSQTKHFNISHHHCDGGLLCKNCFQNFYPN